MSDKAVYIIAANHVWYESLRPFLSKRIDADFIYIGQESNLSFERLKDLNPQCVFFPHWSNKIPVEIYENFECIIFHMTDVPFGRGGSPLQNLISRGIYETRISALRCTSVLDGGPVYLKESMSLHGTAEEIYIRASKLIGRMIEFIIINKPSPVEQVGEVITFPRRKPEDGNIEQLKDIEQVFDFIRMLDAEGYPRAFIETERFRFEFQRPSLKAGKVVADVIITEKG